jgi:hypothetical protein
VSPLLAAWLAEVVLIAYRSARSNGAENLPIGHLALPSTYASTMIVYGALAFVPPAGAKLANTIGWGLVLATFLNLWEPGKTVNNVTGAAAVSQTASNQKATSNVDTGAAQKGS